MQISPCTYNYIIIYYISGADAYNNINFTRLDTVIDTIDPSRVYSIYDTVQYAVYTPPLGNSILLRCIYYAKGFALECFFVLGGS